MPYDVAVDHETARLLRRIRRIARSTPLRGPVRLSRRYLRAVRQVEALACNRTGADKSWVGRLLASSRQHFRRARRVR